MPVKKSAGVSKPKECPLFLCKNGQWAKKVRGKRINFGTDLDAALKRWAEESRYWLAGTRPPTRSTNPTVAELANVFYAAYQRKVEQEEITQRHLDGCKATLERFISIVGADCRLDTLTPNDFDEIRSKLFEPKTDKKTARGGVTRKQLKRRSIITVDGDVRRLIVFFNWAVEKQGIPPVNIGSDFKPSSRTQIRVHKAKKRNGRQVKFIPAEDARAILAQCSISFKPIVLLALNAGLGGLDIANMNMNHIANLEKKECWIDFPRLKTGVERRLILWPETIQAIREYLPHRPEPKSIDDEEILFLTSKKVRWIRATGDSHCDSITSTFTKLRKAAGVDHWKFYDCRRAFATVACQTQDLQTVRFVMGHAESSNDMLAEYVQEKSSDQRIKKVCNHVRKWLFGKKVAK